MGSWRNKSKFFPAAASLILAFITGCATGPVISYGKPPLQADQIASAVSGAKKIVLMPFRMPDYARPARDDAGRIFYLELMNHPVFRRVAREERFPWFDEGETDAERFRAAAEHASRAGYDLVLLGEVRRMIISQRTSMEVAMSIYALDAHSGRILFVEEQVVTGLPGRSWARYILTASTDYVFPPSLEEMIRLASADLAKRCSLHFF